VRAHVRFTLRVVIWALVSRSCRETVDLYFDAGTAIADLEAAIADVPEGVDDLEVVPLRWLERPELACLN
jgi:hypothetical protein